MFPIFPVIGDMYFFVFLILVLQLRTLIFDIVFQLGTSSRFEAEKRREKKHITNKILKVGFIDLKYLTKKHERC